MCKDIDLRSCHIDRGYMGVKLHDMSDQLKEHFGVKNGALVGEVLKETPAEKAGLMAGDVITHFDSRRVDDNKDLHYFLKKTKPDEEYNLSVSRKGASQSLTIKLGKYPSGCHSKGCSSKDCGMIELKCFGSELGHLEIELDNLDEHLEKLDMLKDNIDVKVEELEGGEKRIEIRVKE